MNLLSGVPGLYSLRIRVYKKILYRCGTRFDIIGLKPALVEHWLATFIVTSKHGLAQ